MKLTRELNPKALVYWLLGAKAGTTLVAVWKWLWGIPIESGGKIAVEAAKESLESMQRAVAELTESVAKVEAAHKSALAKYGEKQKEHTELLQQATLAHQKGHPEAARLAMTKAIAVEKILPPMQERVSKAEAVVKAARDKLRREQEKIELYKLEMSNLKAMGSINEALTSINDFDSSLDLGGARDRFEDAGEAIQSRYLQENARAELGENQSEKISLQLDELTLDDEITRRLAELSGNN
ncbi:PspA/IM30 family protein [Pannus brasiliensis CCIBt3594]|uniref:PspA/IM30 family protein n=1 Tax=Pannus brasiliensis CCIBt3594 TaxID=1427578 RepID=A0AAW9QMA3_9CHRO